MKHADEIVKHGACTIYIPTELLSLDKGKYVNIPYPDYYHKKILSEEHYKRRKKGRFRQLYNLYVTPEKLKTFKTLAEQEDYLNKQMIAVAESKEAKIKAINKLFGDNNRRSKVELSALIDRLINKSQNSR